jgi:hypothetical protein
MMDNDYEYWKLALALGDKINEDRELRVSADDPQPGFYRTRNRKAVAIWFDDDGLNFLVDGTQVLPDRQESVWLEVCRRPVTEEQWRAYGETGKWHDIDPAVLDTLGSNIAGAEDPETLQKLLEQLQEAAKGYTKIASDDDSKRAHSIRARINELRLRAEKLHKAEKEPHLRAGQAVDRKWNPMVASANAAGSALGRAMAAWEDDKRMAIRRAEIERQRLEDEAKRLKETLGEAELIDLPPPPVLPEPQQQIRSGHGRAAAVSIKKVVAKFDMHAVFEHFINDIDVIALMAKLAQRAVDAGITIEGTVTEEKASVR